MNGLQTSFPLHWKKKFVYMNRTFGVQCHSKYSVCQTELSFVSPNNRFLWPNFVRQFTILLKFDFTNQNPGSTNRTDGLINRTDGLTNGTDGLTNRISWNNMEHQTCSYDRAFFQCFNSTKFHFSQFIPNFVDVKNCNTLYTNAVRETSVNPAARFSARVCKFREIAPTLRQVLFSRELR